MERGENGGAGCYHCTDEQGRLEAIEERQAGAVKEGLTVGAELGGGGERSTDALFDAFSDFGGVARWWCRKRWFGTGR